MVVGPVSLERPSESRSLAVCLRQIRPEVRFTAARQIAAREPGWAQDVLAAAIAPSPTVYYVNESAWMRLVEVAA